MTTACTWARNQQREGLKRKFCGREFPPLCRPDGTAVTNSGDKASLFTELLTNKMKVDDLRRLPPQLELETHRTVTTVSVTTEQVEQLLSAVDVTKATDPDDVSL